MSILKVEGQREFYYTYMRYHAIEFGFNNREIAVAAEFLYFRSRYVKTPLTKPEMVINEQDEEVLSLEPMTMMEQLKDHRTLSMITTNLDMSFTVFRNHVQGLTIKKFFNKGKINPKLIPADNCTATFKLQVK